MLRLITSVGKELHLLRKKIRIYHDLALEAKKTSRLLKTYIEEESEENEND